MRVLVVGAHPDDQEIGMGGTIAMLVGQGHDVLLLDLTNGEPTPFGDQETRIREAGRAAEILGVRRLTLDLPNRTLEHTVEARHRVAGVMRTHQADIVFAQYSPDAHPDHNAATRIVEDARFDAKLTKTDLPGEPIYPKWFFYYYCLHIRTVLQPSFLVDISDHLEVKREAIMAYESQIVRGGRESAMQMRIDSTSHYLGSRIGVSAAEPFYTREPLGLTTFGALTLVS